MAFFPALARWACTLMALLLALVSPRAWAVEEDELKAAIVFNILLFVEWPAEALPVSGLPLVLCVGPGAVLNPALKSLQGKPLNKTRLEVRDTEPGAVSPSCHAMFVEAQDGMHAATPARPGTLPNLLVISDDAALPSPAAAVILRRVGNRVAFDVNLHAARLAHLQLSSKLLRLAKVVKE